MSAVMDRPYAAFIHSKTQSDNLSGFTPNWMPSFLFDFQSYEVDWAVEKGRGAVLNDCGLGKTIIELVWSENVVRHSNKPVLNLTPLAVSSQTVREAEKFGIEAVQSRDGKFKSGARIIVTNYEQIEKFKPEDFAGVVCDESGILKSFEGTRRAQITEFMRTRPYRLLGTATPSPNDYIELGTSSEALGELGYLDMLGRFFKNEQSTIKPMRYTGFGAPRGRPEEHTDKWRFKGHAEKAWMQWVCSWARACRKPSDLGFDDTNFVLLELIERQHIVAAETLRDGMLFPTVAIGLEEQNEERRRTLRERCELVANLVEPHDCSLIWCDLNPEGDLLEKIVKDAVQVSGKDKDEAKEEKFMAFTTGQIKRLVTKRKIGAWGMNWQHCAHMTSFPTNSFEQHFQGTRRVWRFGQKRKVISDIVTTEGGRQVMANMLRKSNQADKMFSGLVREMNNALRIERTNTRTIPVEVPAWL